MGRTVDLDPMAELPLLVSALRAWDEKLADDYFDALGVRDAVPSAREIYRVRGRVAELLQRLQNGTEPADRIRIA